MYSKHLYFVVLLRLLEWVRAMSREYKDNYAFRCFTTNVLEYSKGLGDSEGYVRLVKTEHALDHGLLIDIEFSSTLFLANLKNSVGYVVNIAKFELPNKDPPYDSSKPLLSTKEVISDFENFKFITQKKYQKLLNIEIPYNIDHYKFERVLRKHTENDLKASVWSRDPNTTNSQTSSKVHLFIDLRFLFPIDMCYKPGKCTNKKNILKLLSKFSFKRDMGLIYDGKTGKLSPTHRHMSQVLSSDKVGIKCVERLPPGKKYTLSHFLPEKELKEHTTNFEYMVGFFEKWFVYRAKDFKMETGLLTIKLGNLTLCNPRLTLELIKADLERFIYRYEGDKNDHRKLLQSYQQFLTKLSGILDLNVLDREYLRAVKRYNPDLSWINILNKEGMNLKTISECRGFILNCIKEARFIIDQSIEDIDCETKKPIYKKRVPIVRTLDYFLTFGDQILVLFLFDENTEKYIFGNENVSRTSDMRWIFDLKWHKTKMIKENWEINKPNVFRYFLEIFRNYYWVRNLNGLLDYIDYAKIRYINQVKDGEEENRIVDIILKGEQYKSFDNLENVKRCNGKFCGSVKIYLRN